MVNTNPGESNQEVTINNEPPVRIEVSAFPNPAKDFTTITFKVLEAGPVEVGIYTSQGMPVGQLYEDMAEADKTYEIEFNASGLLDGIYLIRVNTMDIVETKKLIIKR